MGLEVPRYKPRNRSSDKHPKQLNSPAGKLLVGKIRSMTQPETCSHHPVGHSRSGEDMSTGGKREKAGLLIPAVPTPIPRGTGREHNRDAREEKSRHKLP